MRLAIKRQIQAPRHLALPALPALGLSAALWGNPFLSLALNPANPPELQAQAGPQVASAPLGRPIQLDGSQSQPIGQVGYRWMQLAGPPVQLQSAHAALCTFQPASPGLYRFALVVARGSRISEPDTIDLHVLANPAHVSDVRLAHLVHQALAALPEGPERAAPIAEALDAVAARFSLYESYAQALDELSRRLVPLMPEHPAARAAWDQHLWLPASATLAEAARAWNFDLARPDALGQPLPPDIKPRFAAFYQDLAQACRIFPNSNAQP